MTSAWEIPGPPARDALSAWSNARLSTARLSAVPPVSAPPAPGRFELVDGRGVYLRRVDGPAAAVPVWYVHGLAGSSTNWSRMSEMLGRYAPGRVVDLPGSGRSDPPPSGRYSITADADLIAALIARIDGRAVHLVGNSLGGMIAVEVAARHPELIRTLTLISPAVPDLRLSRDRGADPRLAVLLMPGTSAVAQKRLLAVSPLQRATGMGELCFGDPTSITAEDYRLQAADLALRGALPWAQTSTVEGLRALMRAYLQPGRWAFAAAARRVAAPTLVIWGTRDRLVDARLSRRTAGQFADSRLLVIAGSGHVAQMEHPELTARATLALWEDGESARPADDPSAGAPHRSTLGAVATSTS